MKKLLYSVALCSSLTILPTISHAALGDQILKQGMKNNDVQELQNKLKQKGYFKQNSTGYFGSATKSSVLSFQRTHHLTADGIVGPKTVQALGQSAASTSSISSAILKLGMKNNDVKEVQTLLKQKGYFKSTVTGYYGFITKDAVMAFQRAHNLKADGIVGPNTYRVLIGMESAPSKTSSAVNTSKTLKSGMKGTAVQQLQQALKNKGYFSGNATGYFGSITKSAVMAFQRSNGLAVDGIAGPATLKKLSSNQVVAASSSVAGVSTMSVTNEVISLAKRLMGTPYVWGGTTPNGFDCSGFLNYVFEKAGISLPRTVAGIYAAGTKVSNPSVGDLVFFETYQPGASHAGIYLGNGSFIHASSSKGVMISSLSNSYWKPRYIGSKSFF
ncbi:C40 family peptidase [Priestia abyssalis]|uniref:C40 family peptidase n=1 Tax=Priestia abyssalis TaxID=1221450 RepID=UPI0009950EBF|nr:peptidoglycan-binding protein [Priestia abyssalis]